jgi:hypothetical protein
MNYIYIKTHNITKKKYIGIHDDNKMSIERYRGSGLYWKNHLKKHGYSIKTEILNQHEDRKAALEMEDYYVALSGALTWNKEEFCNISPGGRCGKPGFLPKNKGRKMVDLYPNYIDPRKGKTWEEIYGQTEAEIKKIKQSIQKGISQLGKKHKPRETIDGKTGRALVDIYGYNKYANPPKPFTIKFTYPDNKIEVRMFDHEQDFFKKTKLETFTLFKLKTDKIKVIKKIQSTTKHIYPKGTILEIIE